MATNVTAVFARPIGKTQGGFVEHVVIVRIGSSIVEHRVFATAELAEAHVATCDADLRGTL